MKYIEVTLENGKVYKIKDTEDNRNVIRMELSGFLPSINELETKGGKIIISSEILSADLG